LAISKRLRYEILQRDNYTCRYCGAFAPVVVLNVDHVVPRKLGGSDLPGNLVTACEDCNSGKSAMMPPPGLLAEIEVIAQEWARAEHGTPNEDDLREMYAYQEALYLLESLTPDQVLHCIAAAYAAAMPYRPTHPELIRAAGSIARRELAESEVTSQ
jgi:HNH endonuclease